MKKIRPIITLKIYTIIYFKILTRLLDSFLFSNSSWICFIIKNVFVVLKENIHLYAYKSKYKKYLKNNKIFKIMQ